MAERFADYFGLQLRLAVLMSQRLATPLPQALDLYTNLRRRFGLADQDDPAWRSFQAQIDAMPDEADRLALIMARHRAAPVNFRPADQAAFGCFACDPPDAAAAVHIHFMNVDVGAEPGPLSAARRDERLAELAAMFAFVRTTYPDARRVIGGSWLYNLEAYRRLFPPQYGDSRRPTDAPVRLSGTSTWGQLVDHRGMVRPDAHARLLERFESIDVARPWLAFPLRAMSATAPVEAFFDFYGVRAGAQAP